MRDDFLPVSPHKRGAVGEYLCRHFAEYKLGDHYDHLADTYVFRLSKKGTRLVLEVHGDFLKDRRAVEISRELAQRDVAAVLNRCRSALLTDGGVEESRRISTLL